jgi:hypothetical protein
MWLSVLSHNSYFPKAQRKSIQNWCNWVLATEVTPGLQQEQSPTPISLCHDLFNGVIEWKLTQNDVVSNSETRPGMHGQVRS